MRPVPVLLSAVCLAACSPAQEAPNQPDAAAGQPAPRLGGVDLGQPVRVLGTEPFWSLELGGNEMVYAGTEPPEQRAPQPRPVIQGTAATWQSQTTDGKTLNVTLIATECSDGMSDRTYPLTAMVKLGDEDLTGCAAPTAAILTPGESGPVGQ